MANPPIMVVQAPPEQPRAGLSWKLLNTKHPEYDAGLWHRLDLLYRGGYAILKEADLFLPRSPGEAEERYGHRKAYSSYIAYMGQVVGYLVGALFSSPLSMTVVDDPENPEKAGEPPDPDFYRMFAEDIDLSMTTDDRFLADAVAHALVFKRCIIGVDMPVAPAAATKLDEESLGGGRAYCFHVPLECVINWECDDTGRMIGATLHDHVCAEETPWGRRATNKHRFKIWRILGNVAEYSIYETRELTEHDIIPDDEIIPQTVPWTPTSFREVPLKIFEIDDALWVGNKAGPLAEEHFRGRSDLRGAIGRSLVAVGYIKQGPEIPEVHGAMPSEVAQNPNRGEEAFRALAERRKGWAIIGSQDEIGFAEPTGRAFEIADKQNADLRDEIFRTVHAMALSLANTGAAVGRSGDSKREDRSATEIVLTELGSEIRTFAVKLYTCVSEARNETVAWTAHGLDKFNTEDRTERVTEAGEVALLDIPSVTFKRIYLTDTALSLAPNASPKEKEQITSEIAAGVEERHEESELMRKAGVKTLVEGGPGEEDGDKEPEDDEDDDPDQAAE